MALGHSDTSLAQAMEAEVTEMQVAHDREAERHGQHCMAFAAQAQLKAIEKEALTTLLLQPGGNEVLCAYLAEPRLCCFFEFAGTACGTPARLLPTAVSTVSLR